MESDRSGHQGAETDSPQMLGGVEISVVAPCLNEEGNIPELVSRVFALFDTKHLQGELILIDD